MALVSLHISSGVLGSSDPANTVNCFVLCRSFARKCQSVSVQTWRSRISFHSVAANGILGFHRIKSCVDGYFANNGWREASASILVEGLLMNPLTGLGDS